jgi:hypothetical protein
MKNWNLLARRMKATQDDNVGTSKGQETALPLLPTATNSPDLEIKDAQLVFGAIWRELEREFGRSRMRFPRELILLGGAPGAGKGTNSDFIRKVRGITALPIVVSQLLETPEARAVKARGAMVGDREVEIYSEEKKVFRFSVRFRNPEIRGFELAKTHQSKALIQKMVKEVARSLFVCSVVQRPITLG